MKIIRDNSEHLKCFITSPTHHLNSSHPIHDIIHLSTLLSGKNPSQIRLVSRVRLNSSTILIRFYLQNHERTYASASCVFVQKFITDPETFPIYLEIYFFSSIFFRSLQVFWGQLVGHRESTKIDTWSSDFLVFTLDPISILLQPQISLRSWAPMLTFPARYKT